MWLRNLFHILIEQIARSAYMNIYWTIILPLCILHSVASVRSFACNCSFIHIVLKNDVQTWSLLVLKIFSCLKIFSWSAVGCCNTFIHRSFVGIPAELLHVITGKSYCTLSVQTISIPLNSLLNSSMQYATISNFLQHTLEIFSYFIFILTTFINFHPALLDFENRYQQFCRD